ncbi:MAG: hypothetical protein RLY20_1633 [Verrucomicrobiota bacterium]
MSPASAIKNRLLRPWLGAAALLGVLLSAAPSAAQIRDGGVDPRNLGKGVWIYSMVDATNKLGGHIASVTNENSLFAYFRNSGLKHVIVKAATSSTLFGDCKSGPQFNSNLVAAAHANSLQIFGYNRSYGSNIVGEVVVADYVFNQGADGFVFDAEAEWESSSPWITNAGPTLAWQLCSTVRSNWPNKFLAHAPFAIIYFHSSFPYKEFGFWCDAVMPQVYHFSTAGLKNSPSATLNWADVNFNTWQNSLASLPATNIGGVSVVWTNAIKPVIPVRDVYGEVIAGGIICEGAASAVYSDEDVLEFNDYVAADPHAPTAGGYQGVNYWRADTTGTNQWQNIANGSCGRLSNIVNNIVLDDSRATVVGAWTPVKVFSATTTSVTNYVTAGATNSFGTNFWSKVQGTGAAWMEYRPNILIPGNYDVFQWHPDLTNASAGTPFLISHVAGTNTVFANQQTNGGAWTWLGRFQFASGTNGFIRVLDNFSDASNVAVVDGLKLVYANEDVVLDNTNAEVTFAGSWTLGTTAVGRYLADYRFASSSNGGPSTATYIPNLPNPGFYDVSAWYPAGANRASNAPHRLRSFGGETNVLVNQQVNGGFWFPLVTAWPFLAGTNGFLQLSNNAGPSVVMADALKFSFVAPLVVPQIESISSIGAGVVQLRVTSTPGYPVWLERGTNFASWFPLTNQLSTNGSTLFLDANATNAAAGFYRARQ